MNMDSTPLTLRGPGGAQSGALAPAKRTGQHQNRSVTLPDKARKTAQRPATGCAQKTQAAKPDPGYPDLAAPLVVNDEAPWYCPPAKRVPRPRHSPKLKGDTWLNHTSGQPDTLGEIEKTLERRRLLEAQGKGDEFTFEPLVTTLENMAIFIRHIRDGQQFAKALNAEEDRAMAWLEEKTALLIKDKAPYKRTVQLAMALVTVCEELTRRRILRPLRNLDTLFFQNHCSQFSGFISLDRLIACSWGGNNATVDKGHEEFFTASSYHLVWNSLSNSLNRDDMLLYPSFEPLELSHFCSFGHLAVHPVGMTTDYACNADGTMMSPLMFAVHDLDHMENLEVIGRRDYQASSAQEALLCSPAGRLGWRQCLLATTSQLTGLAGKPALELLLFELFHERSPSNAARHLAYGYSSFLGCLQALGKARRHNRAGYHPDFQQVTDSQAAMAALWAVRLWKHWQAAGYHLTPEQLRAHALQFARAEAPALEKHLTFINQHRPTLRRLFAETPSWQGFIDGHYRIHVLADSTMKQQSLTLFTTWDPDSGLRHLDNTDMAYFSALGYPDQRAEIERRTGAFLPPDLVFASTMEVTDP